MVGNKNKGSIREKLETFLGINYKHKSSAYWFALAIPQLIVLIFILYITGAVMVRHVYHYFNPEARFAFPGMKVLNFLGGEHIDTDDEKVESKLLKETMKSEKFEPLRRFHAIIPDTAKPGMNPVCFICHGDMPHKANKGVRSILNMHTEFAACFACHLDKVPEGGVTYKWYNPTDIAVKGAPFGTKYDAKTGRLMETDDRYSKITPFVVIVGKETSLEVPEDSPEAKDYMQIRDKLTPAQQGKIKAMFHKNVAAKGKFCDQCHTTDKGILDFTALGFEEMRKMDLTGLNLIGIVSKYKDFYIPTIYKAAPEQELSREEPPQNVDPRSWWREKYNENVPKKD